MQKIKKLLWVSLLVFVIACQKNQTPEESSIQQITETQTQTQSYNQSGNSSQSQVSSTQNQSSSEKTYAKIAVFNLEHLGWAESDYKYQKLAENIQDYDLVGLIEVMNQTGTYSPINPLNKLKAQLEQKTGETWLYYVSEYNVGNSAQYREYYAYIWKKSKVSASE